MGSPTQNWKRAIVIASWLILLQDYGTARSSDYDNDIYNWEAGKWKSGFWGPCQLNQERNIQRKDGLCLGIRRRIVECYSSQGDDKVSTCPEPAPPANVSCFTVCPQDCVVSSWSSWSVCKTCEDKKYRTRQILVVPSNYGNLCPVTSQSTPCISECAKNYSKMQEEDAIETLSPKDHGTGDKTTNYKLRVEKWGICQHATLKKKPVYNFGRGYNKKRGKQRTKASSTRHSKMEAMVDANIREPSAVLRLESNNNNLIELPEYLTKLQLSKFFSRISYPELGVQERILTCVGEVNDTNKTKLCQLESNAVKTRSCIIPVNCEITEWSNWKVEVSGCIAPNGQIVKEVKVRTRTALSLQKGAGRPCPHLLERHTSAEPSLVPCDARYMWLVSSWGPCFTTVGPDPELEVTCGGGVQKREITCVHKESHIPVEEERCMHVAPPPRYQRCEVGCERDCIMSPWSRWNDCSPADCNALPTATTTGFRKRRREVLVSASLKGLPCPHLEEKIACLEPHCHKWLFGTWSECQLEDNFQRCGKGIRTRNYSCIDAYNGAPTTNEKCRAELGPTNDIEACQIPCPFDCVLAPWSSWTPCSRSCSTEIAVGYTHRNTSILAPPGPGGRGCPAPDELTEVKTCREEPCAGSAWIAGDWGSCSTNETKECGQGVQARTVYCVDLLKHEKTAPFKCFGLPSPQKERHCQLPCISSCLLTLWSEWSGCTRPKLCENGERIITSVQRRWRRVLVKPSPASENCDTLEEERTCAVTSEVCRPAKWVTTKWSKCLLASGIKCGTGFRVRAAECFNGSDKITEPSECLLGDVVVPETSEECFVSCNTSCVLSRWSELTPCPTQTPCSGVIRERKRELLDLSENDPKCFDIHLVERQSCDCQMFYSTPASNWSDCILGPTIGRTKDSNNELLKLPSENTRHHSRFSLHGNDENECGVGNRYRSIKCLREDGIFADPSLCGNGGLQWEPCMVECPSDCLVGTWGQWSSCNALCGAGIQLRRREIMQHNLWNGRECPETEQIRACWGSCVTRWLTEGWSDCNLDKGECGTGYHNRTVRCVQTSLTGIEEATSDQICDKMQKPTSGKSCRIYCPGNCVVSEWSEWSICPAECPNNQYRFRSRQIIRIPAGNSSSCPHLEEEESCLNEVSCYKYRWVTGNWTSCAPIGYSSCGEGIRNRAISCVRSDGQNVEERFCVNEMRPSPQEKWCYVDCPIDCILTSWSSWDHSECSCGENGGNIERRRYNLVNPSKSGRSCPLKLKQSLPCPLKPCYTWERSPWSECDLQGGNCGHGIMTRLVRCIGPGGTEAQRDKCLSLVHVGGHTWPYLAHALDLYKEDGCFVPCEGDCEITEWSPWSHCHRDCNRGHKEGTQTRSRVVLSNGSSSTSTCPGPLWENRPCLTGPCLTFSWKIIHERLTCIRSDGLIVTGGCGDAPRPCVPECIVEGSKCSPVGVCVCKEGLRPHYSPSKRYHLAKCHPIVNLSLSKSLRLSQPKYLPESINGWMFAMIGTGSIFVIFVAMSVYLMCQSPREQSPISLTHHRHNTMSYPNSAHST